MQNRVTVNIKGIKKYDIAINNDFSHLADELGALFDKKSRICVISDSNVAKLYIDAVMDEIRKSFDAEYISIELGEDNKNIETVRSCYDFLLEHKFTRKDVVLALGGGICGDVAGFVASTFMRGMSFVQVPTTLLSMVDSSSGGKTGVNFNEYKNMIGAFKMPDLVYINTDTLNTLPGKEYASGMAEVLKAGLIRDASFYEWLINSFYEINEKDPEALEYMIAGAINIKRLYVENDPYELGERAILNFGHTVGHALEKYTAFKYSHGECVALGSVVAAYISYKKGYLSTEEYYEIRDMFVPFDLPISLENIDRDRVTEFTRSDKKNSSGTTRFILLKKIGKGIISEDVTEDEIREALGQIDYDPND